MVKLIHHHIKYKEIHGIDEIVLMEQGEHQKLHNRLRREGKCNIPPKILTKISSKACQRTERTKALKRFNTRYQRRFTKTVGKNTSLVESVWYNPKTDNLSVSSWFQANNPKNLS